MSVPKRGRRVLMWVGIVLATIGLLVAGGLAGLAASPAVPTDYTRTVATGGPIEARYLAQGPHKVSNRTVDAMQYFSPYRLWFPEDIMAMTGPLPVVLVANGTGIKAAKYPAWFEHLASWGFIVIGTDDEYAWSGFSQGLGQRLLVRLHEGNVPSGWTDNPLSGKVDLGRVGVAGHSQGGAGVFNTLAQANPGVTFKAAFAASPANLELAKNLDWLYDPSKDSVPTLLVSSTGKADENLVTSLTQLRDIYGRIPATTDKAMLRRNDGDHGDMLYLADGYMTAWFVWHLQGDEGAKAAFAGTDPEIFHNSHYQDQETNLRR